MDASLTDFPNLAYSNMPPILLAASSEAAMMRAERTINASSLRLGATISIEEAGERLDRQGSAAALWIELDRDCGGPMDELLSRVSSDVAAGRYPAIISTTAA